MPTFRKNLQKQYILIPPSPKWDAQDFPVKVPKGKLKLLIFNLKI